MKNLKKVLALVLAFACAFTMFAGAAFTDSADIKATEAVDTLVALGVIKGYEDGSFRPDATVTRAEMAKMIYVLRTGKDDASAYAAAATKFDDLNGASTSWAAGYIKYCEALGIIAGKSATKFDPAATVTGEEAAKMLLVTLGYDAEKAGLIGTSWAKTTIALADENGLLDDVNAPMSLALPRQYAAQMMFNAVDANTVKLTDGEYSNMNIIGTYYPTIGEKYMGLKKTVGTLASVTKEDNKSTYSLEITGVDADSSSDKALTSFTGVAKDYSAMKYQQVKVLYKAKDNVYGVYATKDNESNTGVLAKLKMDSDKVKLDGTKYTLTAADKQAVYVDGAMQYKHTHNAEGTEAVSFTSSDKKLHASDVVTKATIKEWVTVNAEGNATYKEGTKVELLSTDGTAKVSILNVTPFAVEKVTYVGSDYINASGKRSNDDYNYSSDIKKDDYVMISAAGNYADGKGVITKATVVEGKVTGKSGSDKVKIDGTYYTMATGITAPDMSASVKLVVVNGYVYVKDTISGSASDVALVVEIGDNNTVGSSNLQARMIFADGTDKVVSIEKKDGNDKTISYTPKAIVDKLATYDVSKDVYTLTFVENKAAAVDAGFDDYSEGADKTVVDGSIRTDARTYFNTDASVFVKYDTDSYKVLTGTAVKNWKSTETKGTKAIITKDGTSNYTPVAFVNLGSKSSVPGGSSTTYAVALKDYETEKVGGTTYYLVKGWNGTEEVTYKTEDKATIMAGELFEYSSAGTDLYSIDAVTGMKEAQVSVYDKGTGDISFMAANGTDDATIPNLTVKNSVIDSKDTTVLYVDSDGNKGVGGGEIRLGNYFDKSGEASKANVSVYVSGSDEDCITVLVVDVNNNITKW